MVGSLVPQRVDGGRWSDDELGDGFAVLIADEALHTPPGWESVGATTHAVGSDRTGGHGLVIVRPDRYVAAVADTQAAADTATAALLERMAVGRVS